MRAQYYNMRMKTLKRDATNIVAKGHELHQVRIRSSQETLAALLRIQKGLQYWNTDPATGAADNAGPLLEPAAQPDQDGRMLDGAVAALAAHSTRMAALVDGLLFAGGLESGALAP